MKKGKKRAPRVLDKVTIKEEEMSGVIVKIEKGKYFILFGHHDDQWTEEYRRSHFTLDVPCLGHPLTNIFE